MNEIEARSGVYSYTESFMALLDNLCSVYLPLDLGYPKRIPGVEPYLAFLINDVFLRYQHRSYKHPAAKWLLASGSLQIFVHILETYDANVRHNVRIDPR